MVHLKDSFECCNVKDGTPVSTQAALLYNIYQAKWKKKLYCFLLFGYFLM